MTFRALLAAALLCALPANRAAAAGQKWEALRAQAESLESLASFLDHFVGRCPSSEERRECQAKAARDRAARQGRLFHVRLDERATRLLQPGRYSEQSGELQLGLTPFFDADGLALTEGKPLSLDAQGRPRIALVPLTARLGPAETPRDFERLMRTGQVRIELIFRPLGLWSLSGAGGRLEGARSSLMAIRVLNARTGAVLAERLR